MAGCGYTPDEINAMPMHDVLALLRAWQDAPPAHEILLAVHGVKRAAPFTADPQDPSGIGALIARFPDGHVNPNK